MMNSEDVVWLNKQREDPRSDVDKKKKLLTAFLLNSPSGSSR